MNTNETGTARALRGGAWALACLASCGIATAQTVYKSIGPDGRVVYSDHAPAAGKVEKTLIFVQAPASALPASAASFMERFRQAHPGGGAGSPAAATGGVTLYSAAWCRYCRAAKAWLGAQGVSYAEVDVDTPAGMAAFAQATGGRGGIPVLVANGKRVNGFSADAYQAVFARR